MHFNKKLYSTGLVAIALLLVSSSVIKHLPEGTLIPLSLNTTPPPPSPDVAASLVAKQKHARFAFLRGPQAALAKLGQINTGVASWYGAVLQGHTTASGEIFDMNKMTACHRTLPFGTMVRVVDVKTHKSVIVKINDRGVLFAERVIDLSRAAAERLGMRSAGVANVRLEVISKEQATVEQAVEMAAAKTSDSPADAPKQ